MQKFKSLLKKPITRGECASVPRPCPFVSCKYNMSIDCVGDKIVENNITKGTSNCCLDHAEDGPLSLSDIGRMYGYSREYIRQVEKKMLTKLRGNTGLREYYPGRPINTLKYGGSWLEHSVWRHVHVQGSCWVYTPPGVYPRVVRKDKVWRIWDYVWVRTGNEPVAKQTDSVEKEVHLVRCRYNEFCIHPRHLEVWKRKDWNKWRANLNS